MCKKTAMPLICLVLAFVAILLVLPSGAAFAETQTQPNSPTQAVNETWAVSNIPADDWDAFFLFYQRFLRERLPRTVRKTNDKSKDHAAQIQNQRELAALLEKFSEVCNSFAHSGMFPAFADPAIKKEDKERIPGTWNFYRNISPNTSDIWQESCFLRFLALLYESEIDFDRLAQVNEYADQVAEFEPIQKLHRQIKRVWVAKTLYRIDRFADRENVPCDDRLNEQNAGSNAFAEAIREFREFLPTRFDRENIELLENFVDTAEHCRTEETHDLLRQMLVEAEAIASRQVKTLESDPAATAKKKAEAAEMLELIRLDLGMIRRQDLIGQELQIWGHDIDGNAFDTASLEGKVVLLDFWATWCAPCIAEFPRWKMLYEKYHEQGFEILGYSVDTDMERLSTFLEKKPLPWPVLVREKTLEKGEPPLSTFYGAKKLPVVILRDRQGKVVLLDARGKTLEETLERMFAE